jgi:hypothetical protein
MNTSLVTPFTNDDMATASNSDVNADVNAPGNADVNADGNADVNAGFPQAIETSHEIEPLDPKRLKRNPVMSRLSWTLAALLIGAVGYGIGARVTKDQQPASPFPNLPAGLARGGGGGLPDIAALLGGGGGGAGTSAAELSQARSSAGEVVLVSGGKIYVKLADGSTKAVLVTSGTDVASTVATSADKIVVGSTVLVDGRTEENGVIAANAIIVTSESK